MKAFLVKRLISAVVTLAVVVIITFLLTHVIPGDPTTTLIGDFPAPPGYIQQVRHEFGLDQSIWAQLWLYVTHLVRGDFGYSFANRQPVVDLIGSRAVHTLILLIPALVLSSALGIALGVTGSRHIGTARDKAVIFVSLIGYSVPVFWLGQLLIVLFAVRLGWLPAQGMHTIGRGDFFDLVQHWVLPGLCVTVYYLAVVARVCRASMREAMLGRFMETALVKGLRQRRAEWHHAFPNAFIPVLTVIGYNFGFALSGAVLTEVVFGWPGIGLLFEQSIQSKDYPTLEGIFVLTAIAVVVANLLTDIGYARIDPRIRQ